MDRLGRRINRHHLHLISEAYNRSRVTDLLANVESRMLRILLGVPSDIVEVKILYISMLKVFYHMSALIYSEACLAARK